MLTFLSQKCSYTALAILEAGNSATIEFCRNLHIDVEFIPRLYTVRRLVNIIKREMDRASNLLGIPSPVDLVRWLRQGAGKFPHSASPDPYWAQCDDRLQNKIADLCNQKLIDVVIVEYIWLSACIDKLPQSVVKVCDTHDVMHKRRDAFIEARGVVREFGLVDRETEISVLEKFDAVVAIQENEQALLKQMLPRSTVLCVGSGSGLADWEGQGLRRIGWRDSWLRAKMRSVDCFKLLFLGGMHDGNVIALETFLGQNWPAVVARCGAGGIRLFVGGTIGKALAGKWKWINGVTWLGYIGEPGWAYREADAVIVPVWFGSGLKIKTVEALKQGKIVITTPVGIEGLPAEAGRTCIVAHSIEEMTDAVVRVATSAIDREEASLQIAKFADRYLTLDKQHQDLKNFLYGLSDSVHGTRSLTAS